MPETTQYDEIIIGWGEGGNLLAAALSEKGRRTAMIERAAVGGTCVNYGCTPTKTMVASAEVAYLARRAKDYGVDAGDVSIDMPAVRERKRNMVKSWRGGSGRSLDTAEFVDLIRGEASFLRPEQVLVQMNDGGERVLTADLIVINAGLSTSVPELKGLESVCWLDNTSVMELDVVPEHLVVLGGGYVGLEFAQMFRRFGSRVTLIHHSQQLLPIEDADIAGEV